ncbi:MAG TPA: Lin0512 family protein [Anaerovoracaceae bacterium]|nr:Lin0512 family protein [Anaerovoracaceae bacterium]
MKVEVLIGATNPEAVDPDRVAEEIPFGAVSVSAVRGTEPQKRF